MRIILLLILCMFISREADGQFNETRRFSGFAPISFCSRSLIMDSLGFFFLEHGCEGASTVALGKYTIKGNRVRLHYYPHDSFPVIREISYYDKTPDDSMIYLRFFDRFNDTLVDMPVDYFSTEEKRSMIRTDKDRLGYVNAKNKNASLCFCTLYNLFDSSRVNDLIQIPVTSRSMDIYFNLPAHYFYYGHYTQEPDEEQVSAMLFVNRGLYSPDGKTLYYKLQ